MPTTTDPAAIRRWDEWFERFDANDLALLHEDTTDDGERSNFNKLVSCDG